VVASVVGLLGCFLVVAMVFWVVAMTLGGCLKIGRHIEFLSGQLLFPK